MRKVALVCMVLIAGAVPAPAQDIAGIEDCTKTQGLDKRTGCFQSNVNFLQRLVMKNAAEAQQRLNAAAKEIAELKSLVAGLRARIDELQAAQKAGAQKKPEGK
jgi:hypothetical protein